MDKVARVVAVVADCVKGGWVELGEGFVGVLAVEAFLVAVDPKQGRGGKCEKRKRKRGKFFRSSSCLGKNGFGSQNVHGLPVEFSLVGQCSLEGKFGEVDAGQELLEAGEVVLERRGVWGDGCEEEATGCEFLRERMSLVTEVVETCQLIPFPLHVMLHTVPTRHENEKMEKRILKRRNDQSIWTHTSGSLQILSSLRLLSRSAWVLLFSTTNWTPAISYETWSWSWKRVMGPSRYHA